MRITKNWKWEDQYAEMTKEKISANPEHYQDKTVHDMVYDNKELVERGLYGNIVDQTVRGSSLNGSIDDLDWDKVKNMDIIDKAMIDNELKSKLVKLQVDYDEKVKKEEEYKLEAEKIQKQKLFDELKAQMESK